MYLAVLGALLQQHVERSHDLVILRKRAGERVKLGWRDILAVRQPLVDQALRHLSRTLRAFVNKLGSYWRIPGSAASMSPTMLMIRSPSPSRRSSHTPVARSHARIKGEDERQVRWSDCTQRYAYRTRILPRLSSSSSRHDTTARRQVIITSPCRWPRHRPMTLRVSQRQRVAQTQVYLSSKHQVLYNCYITIINSYITYI